MDKNLRKVVIAGNWKMNKTNSEALTLIEEIKPLAAGGSADVVICVPYTSLAIAVQAVKGTNIKVGAQNMHFEAAGAFTGEISAQMLLNIGVEYVVLGHSERRQYFAETDETVNKKLIVALNAGLTPIVCVGETLSEREAEITEERVSIQVKRAFCGVNSDQVTKVIIAYEPVWAIGTGKTATDEQADQVNGFIRKVIGTLYGEVIANGVTIQYGGSMNATNADSLLKKEHIDGGLIGGASLKSKDFAEILNAANN